ncbi:glycosyltransferase family 2 protein [Geodermatophilus sp. SYSU D00696]
MIVSYRSAELVRTCVASIPPTPQVPHIVVVNNDPECELEARVLATLQHDDHRVTVHHSPRNGGFGAGVNQGVRLAKSLGCDSVWILNPDVEVQEGCLQRLQMALGEHPDAMISPVITSGLPPDEYIWFAGGSLDVRRGRSHHFGFRQSLDVLAATDLTVSFLTGTAVMTRVHTFERLGGFREDLFLYWEDVDLSIRAQQMGIPMLVVGEARLWHKQGGSVDDRSDMFFYYAQRNRLIVSWTTAQRGLATMLVGAGFVETLRLLGRPLVRSKQHRMKKLRRSLHGLVAGIAAVRRLQRDPAAAVGGPRAPRG